MAESGAKGNGTLVVALDGDKLGLIGGTALAIAVMAMCFFWRETDAPTALIRTGWAFTAGYGGIYLLVRVILRTTLFEMVSHEHDRKAKRRLEREAEPVQAAAEQLAAGDITLDDLGLQPLTPRSDT